MPLQTFDQIEMRVDRVETDIKPHGNDRQNQPDHRTGASRPRMMSAAFSAIAMVVA